MQSLMLSNRFGEFDATGTVFSITDSRTPMPWVNVVCNGRYGFVVSQNGGGFSWLDNSQLNVITRWEMDLARDLAGRYLYLSDLDSGEVWSLAPSPCFPKYAEYRCEHTTGSTTFRTSLHDIAAVWKLAVAPNDPVEVWKVELTNTGRVERRLRLASFFEWCCGVAPDAKREFHRLFFTTRHDPERRAIFAVKNMWDVPPRTEAEHWNRPWPYAAAHAVRGPFVSDLAVADKRAFLGRAGDLSSPAAMLGEPGAGFGRYGDASASVGGDLRIAPGQTVSVQFLLAVESDEGKVAALLDRYGSADAGTGAARDAGEAWKRRLAPTRVRTERADFDLLNNTWLPYQAISGRLWGRTGYYQQSGAFGFRDQLQDSQVWLPLEPARCREQILLHAAHQFADGSVYHWWHPLTETGLRTACSDDFLWLPFVVCNYLKETGDWAILDEVVPFAEERKRGGEAGGAPESATLLEHCRRSINRGLSLLSPRGLPLIGSCDWNDGLSALGVQGRGESVWLGFFLFGILGDFSLVLRRAGDESTAERFTRSAGTLKDAINTHGWDGRWFRGATRDNGTWIGAAQCKEGRIFLNCQTWAVLTGASDERRLSTAWDAVKEHLLADMGPLLLSPAYTDPDATIGYITRYAPGLRENGGVYMHAATWALAAACMRRDAESVERIWSSISPAWRGRDADSYFAEPYVTPGNVDGPISEFPGRAGWTWYTGSAAWLNRVSLERVLGIRATWEGLEIDPCPPASLGRVDVTRTWRGVPVRVRFDARAFDPAVAARLTVDGRAWEGRVLGPQVLKAAADEGRTIEVEVAWPPVAGAGRIRSAPAAAEGSAVR